ncbi:hypothetical protein [Paraburkholderia sp. BCC1886]|uniref:hypothetical protein n=1 Tax=Paraburkholderia sp. BCC1886 TaxID=2562670 RepID=UPI001184362A|nr:hypothetical protein [Paraburkholderia sp. BCC1886]
MPAEETQNHPETLIVDFSERAKMFEEKIRPFEPFINSDLSSAIDFVTTNIFARSWAEGGLSEAIYDMVDHMIEGDVCKQKTAEQFGDILMELGCEVVEQFDEMGLYDHNDEFPYTFERFLSPTSRTAVFRLLEFE